MHLSMIHLLVLAHVCEGIVNFGEVYGLFNLKFCCRLQMMLLIDDVIYNQLGRRLRCRMLNLKAALHQFQGGLSW